MATNPTQDSGLRLEIEMIVSGYVNQVVDSFYKHTTYKNPEHIADELLQMFERRGYYRGLPSHIEEALNSGDGTYRP